MKTKKTKKTKKIESLPIQTIKCIPVSYLIPVSMLALEVWEKISNDAPFSWGDNNHSLVSPIDFAVHCGNKLDDIKYKKLLKKIRSIPHDVYIDMEN